MCIRDSLDLVDGFPAPHGEPAVAVHHRLGAVPGRALLDLLEGSVLLVAALGVALLAVLDLAGRALAVVAHREAGLGGHLVAPRLLCLLYTSPSPRDS